MNFIFWSSSAFFFKVKLDRLVKLGDVRGFINATWNASSKFKSHTFVQIRLAVYVFAVQTCSQVQKTVFWMQNKVLAGMLLSFTFPNKAALVPGRPLRTVLKSEQLSGCVYSSLKSKNSTVYGNICYFCLKTALLWFWNFKYVEI